MFIVLIRVVFLDVALGLFELLQLPLQPIKLAVSVS